MVLVRIMRVHCVVCYCRDNFSVFLESIFGIYGLFWQLLYRRTFDYGIFCVCITVTLMVTTSRLLTAVFMFLSVPGLAVYVAVSLGLYMILELL